jgi:hypothetical protein
MPRLKAFPMYRIVVLLSAGSIQKHRQRDDAYQHAYAGNQHREFNRHRLSPIVISANRTRRPRTRG